MKLDKYFHLYGRKDDVVFEEIPAPSAQPERVGVWWFEEYPDGYYHAECSECGQWFEEDAYLKPFKFCPNCGARMEGEQE